MVQELSVHRALSLAKTTRNRISDMINDVSVKFIEVKQGKKNTINGVRVEDVEKTIRGNWDKINQLISNLEQLKSALSRSNAGIKEGTELDTLVVAGKNYTLSELITASDLIYGNKNNMGFKALLLSKLKRTYSEALRQVERQHDKIDQEIKVYLNQVAGSDKQQISAEETQKTIDIFHANGDYTLVDPLDLKKTIEELDAEITQFRYEADSAISEKNALTIVKVDLTKVD